MHEKFVPQDMRPLHKKLVDQFHLMKSSLGIQVKEQLDGGGWSLFAVNECLTVLRTKIRANFTEFH